MFQFIKSLIDHLKMTIKYIHFNFYRLCFGKDITRLALGESMNAYKYPRWHLLDVKNSDINLNLEILDYTIPLDKVKFCHSSHMFEHITDEAASYLLKQVFLSMETGGIIRIEVPSSDKILDDYRKNEGRPIARYFSESNKDTLVKVDGYADKYGELHIGTLGAISCVHVNHGGGKYNHIPVYVDIKEFELQLKMLNNDEFCEWAINLQAEEEKSQHGHINYWTESKLTDFLETAGFSKVKICNPGESEYGFDLSIERTHRGFYSIVVEAVR
jgi:hypothetical protein